MNSRIDVYSLRLFLAAAAERSIARAAKREHIAASALSRRLADLEHAFGVPLFVRSPHGISLTDAGRVAAERAEQLEDGLQSLIRDVQSSSGQVCGTVRLFANASSVVGFLPERLQAFCAAFPLVSIELEERMTDDVVRACLDDVADVGVGVITQVPSGLDSWRFAEDPLMVVMPQGHALCAQTSVRFYEVLEYPLVRIQPGGSLDQAIRYRAAASHLSMRIAVSVNSFDATCRMVEAGLGIAIVPTSAAAAYAGSGHFERRALNEIWVARELQIFALHKSPRPYAVAALIEALKI